MPQPSLQRPLTLALLLAVVGALAGATWAALAGNACGSCASAADLLGGKTVAWLGVFFYGVLSAMTVSQLRWQLHWKRREQYSDDGDHSPPGAGSIAVPLGFASGAHAVLVALLFYRRIECLPCLFTAGCAWTAGCVAILREHRHWRRALGTLIAGVAITTMTVLVMRTSWGWSSQVLAERMLPRVVLSLGDDPAKELSPITLVVYEREGCEHCEALRRGMVPAIEQQYGLQVAFDYRAAEPWMNTPTVFVVGPHPAMQIGVDELSDLVALLAPNVSATHSVPSVEQPIYGP